jgi:hypothetical protein
MSDHEQSLARWNTPTGASDILSDATDLDSLLSAILGETSDGVSTCRPASDDIAATDEPRIEAIATTVALAQPDAVVVTDTDPEEAEYAVSPPASAHVGDWSPSSDGLDGFPWERDIEPSGVFQPSAFDDSEKLAFANVAALSGQLQAVRHGRSKDDRSNVLEPEPNLRLAIKDSGLNRRTESKLFIFEPHPYGRSAESRADGISIGELDRRADDPSRVVESSLFETGVRRTRLAKWIRLILRRVGVSSGAIAQHDRARRIRVP